MKKLHLIWFLALIYLSVHAQSLSPLVLSSSGNTIVTPQMRLSWTLGEVAVARWEAFNHAGVLTEGFHQASIERSNHNLSDLELVQILPNPVKKWLTLNVTANTETNYLANLQDAQGKNLIKNLSLKGKVELDMSGYSAGVYFLSIHSTSGVLMQNHKVVKL